MSSALKRIEAKLQDVSNRFKNAGYVGSDKDSKAVSELVNYIRDAVTDCQVSCGVQVESAD